MSSPVSSILALDDAIVDAAVTWYATLASGTHTAQDERAFQQWHASHPDHAEAWRRLQQMGGRMRESTASLPSSLARATLAQAAAGSRRRALKTLMWVGTGGLGLYAARELVPRDAGWAALTADVRTASGEQRDIRLDDGTRLLLNTATAINIRYGKDTRAVQLLYGEIMVETARDPAGRQFSVATRDGRLTPLGTRFIVRRDAEDEDGWTSLAVTAGTVQIEPAQSGEVVLVHAGQRSRFTRDKVEVPAELDGAALAWTDGMFSAEGMRLGDLVAELDRYRRGRLRCDPAVADLRITGVWPLRGPEATEPILASIERNLPVRVSRLTRYWVTVTTR